jgi:PBP1b-binding outer membrane lipoprotein LpoB
MKRNVGIILLIVLLFDGCLDKKAQRKINQNKTDTSFITKYPEITNDTTIQDMINALAISNSCKEQVPGNIAGKDGIANIYFDRFCELATDSLLFQLVQSKIAVIRFDSYRALLARDKRKAFMMRKKLINDTGVICSSDATDASYVVTIGDFVKSVH